MPWEGELPSFDVDAALAALEDETCEAKPKNEPITRNQLLAGSSQISKWLWDPFQMA